MRLVCGEEWYISSLCFWDMVENVSFLCRLLEVIWLLLSSVVSEDGLDSMALRVGGDGSVSRSWLKKDEVGKNMSSVLDFLSPCPVCIWSPISVKVSLIILAPLIASVLLVNGKALSSRYRMCDTVVVFCDFLLLLCPVSWLEVRESLSRLHRSTMVFCMFALSSFASMVSEKAAMISRKMMGDKLSPCRTPVVWLISSFSFPILRTTARSV